MSRMQIAIKAAAAHFDWVGLEQRMADDCKCSMTATELWGTEGCDTDGSRPTYSPPDNPCPACRTAVSQVVRGAIEAWEANP